MTPFRVLLALIIASLFSQFPAFSNQYMILMQAEIAVLERLVSQSGDAEGRTNPAQTNPAEAKAALTPAELRDAGVPAKADIHQPEVRAKLIERRDDLQPNLDALRQTAPFARLAHPEYLDDPQLLKATWMKFQPALPIGQNGLIAAGIGFALGWIVATVLGWLSRWLPSRRKGLA